MRGRGPEGKAPSPSQLLVSPLLGPDAQPWRPSIEEGRDGGVGPEVCRLATSDKVPLAPSVAIKTCWEGPRSQEGPRASGTPWGLRGPTWKDGLWVWRPWVGIAL